MPEASDEAAGSTPHLLKKISKRAWAIIGAVVLIAGLVSVVAFVMAQGDEQPPLQSTQITQSNEVPRSSPPERCLTPSATGCAQANQTSPSFDPSHGECQGSGIVELTSPPLPI